MPVHPKRIFPLNTAAPGKGPVIYWMSREQRVHDNWGLLHARDLAGTERSLMVLFCLVPTFLGATLRQYDFMLRGLQGAAEDLNELGIPFLLRIGDPAEEVVRTAEEYRAAYVVTDFDPLRIKQAWQKAAAARSGVPLVEVDGHNVVPARLVSSKQEYAARTIRPKIHKLLPDFLEDFPDLSPPATAAPEVPTPDWKGAFHSLKVDESVGPVERDPTEASAQEALDDFIHHRLHRYAAERNDPTADAVSGLSAYLHFGRLAPQRAAYDVAATGRDENSIAFLEELIVRRELSENFCLHNPHYDSLEGAPQWALATLDKHRYDPRAYLYTPEQFEQAETHSELWNAAQNQLRISGFMHGYMRMYWAKKILEWSPSPEAALKTTIILNDRYQLDGRDPNGYVGALWSVAGLHDRPWKERPVYGTVRYMNENGCRRKFDVPEYIARWGVGARQASLSLLDFS